MDMLQDKRLLVLGGTQSTYDLVKTAQEMGSYVLVADYLDGGVAKEIANESLRVSTTDIDRLAEVVRQKRIDGVFTGASEFNIQNMLRLTAHCGLPSYCTQEQWNICSNKARFKDMCRANGVPVIQEYDISPALEEEELAQIIYPVIVKPVDGNSSVGIAVCQNNEQLKKAYIAAKENSASGNVIVEQFVQGDNVEAYYVAQDGEIMLCAISDRITIKQPGVAPLPVAFRHPSRYLQKYLEVADKAVCEMFRKVGVKNGMFFLESFFVDGNFFFYEMGYRVNGTLEYHFVDHFNHFNPFKMMISYALTGKMASTSVKELNRPDFGGRVGCELSVLLKEGKIAHIQGVTELKKNPHVIHFIPFHKEGSCINKIGTFNQIFARIHLVAETEDQMRDVVRTVWDTIDILDEDGKSMLLCPYDYVLI